MPALPAVPGVIKLELLWSIDGLPAANVMHAGYTGDPPSAGSLTELCTAFANAFWTDDLKADYSVETTFVGVRATDLSSDTGAVGEGDVSDSGTDGADSLPANCCVLINYSISRRYRGGHPRTYLIPLSKTWQASPSTWNSDILPVVSAAWGAAWAEVVDSTYGTATITGPVCVSYVNAGEVRVDPLVEPITGIVVSGQIRTQRRRLTASSY